MDQKAVLLTTIEAALQFNLQASPLPAHEVNKLGRQLGFSDESTCRLIRQLSAEGKVDLEWGGAVRGVRRDTRAPSPSIYLEANATYIGPGAQVKYSAVGANAQVQINTQIPSVEEDLANIVGEFTVSIGKLTVELDRITQPQKQSSERLIELAAALRDHLAKGEVREKRALTDKLDEASKVLGVIEKARTLGAAASPYLPQAWNMLHHAFLSLSEYLNRL